LAASFAPASGGPSLLAGEAGLGPPAMCGGIMYQTSNMVYFKESADKKAVCC